MVMLFRSIMYNDMYKENLMQMIVHFAASRA
ncbi:hypothetical protein M942_22495 [Enterobacter ludwigii]|nr:hypothetical protein M942_22495 [Enterobacter ludwigii]